MNISVHFCHDFVRRSSSSFASSILLSGSPGQDTSKREEVAPQNEMGDLFSLSPAPHLSRCGEDGQVLEGSFGPCRYIWLIDI
jgi:hypothetical protein